MLVARIETILARLEMNQVDQDCGGRLQCQGAIKRGLLKQEQNVFDQLRIVKEFLMRAVF